MPKTKRQGATIENKKKEKTIHTHIFFFFKCKVSW